MTRRVAIVPHTHWDREWYEPFQTFRMKLVDTFDQLFDLMEADPGYSDFLADGQMAVIDDYLQIRPEARDRIGALAASGRLSMGPWYILMDEFLVSGETIIRDLQMGMSRASAFGGAMEVGYLPDMFGHVAQMPQILAHAGLKQAVVWRGVPSTVTRTGFWWEAPDGSTVRAEYLPGGYGNGALLPEDGKSLVRRTEDHEQEIGHFLIDDLLLMNGSDHLAPQPWLSRIVAEANAVQNDFAFQVTSLAAYLDGAPIDDLERVKGELRSGARSNVLMGVTSNRVDVKRSAAVTERHLERRAEPYAALFLPADRWPERLLDLAWKEVVRNAAHDSICACSVDDVVDAVLHRFAEARHIAEGVADRALSELGRSVAEAGSIVVNPSTRHRSGVVELVVGADEPAGPHEQVVSERFGLPGTMTLDASTMRTVLGMLQGPKIDNDSWVQQVEIEEDETGIDLTVFVGPEERPGAAVEEAKQDLYTRLGARPDVTVRVRLDQPAIRRILARATEVPGLGWKAFHAAPLEHPAHAEAGDASGTTSGATLSNGLVTVSIDPHDGTFAIDGIPGFGRLVDGGDFGDSYNYSPPHEDSTIDTPAIVAVEVVESGPVRASARVSATYAWPSHIDGVSQRRVDEVQATISTTLSIHADEPFIRVRSEFVNPSRDHRLRVHLPLPDPTSSSEAECAFTTVHRGLTAEGRPDELGIPTFPARRFVRAGGLTVVHEGVTEYELVDIEGPAESSHAVARTLALTVLRSTGMLSRLGMTNRPFPAGPLTPVDGLQLIGRPVELCYAVATCPIDPWHMADDVLLPLEVVRAPGGGWRGSEGRAVELSGAEVSSIRRERGALEVRVFNPSDDETIVSVGDRRGWLVDLRGQIGDEFEGSFALRPHGIATFRLPD